MTLYIARHGQTDWNAARRYQARTDVPINATGRSQARALRQRFDELGLAFASAHTSPLMRASETTGILVKGSDTEIVVENDFLEIDLGQWEGLYETEIKSMIGESAYNEWREGGYIKGAPGGESILDVIQRVSTRVKALADLAREQNILVVAHQATNMAIKAVLSGDQTPGALAQYRQANDEVDIWHHDEARVERISVGQ